MNNIDEYDYSKWLNWHENSCLYDAFFLYIPILCYLKLQIKN